MEGIIYQYDNIKTINLNEYELIVNVNIFLYKNWKIIMYNN